MAVRHLNYTDRKRITLDDAVVTIVDGPNGEASFDAVLNLERYRLAADSRVFVEAYRQTTWMRFDFGTVGHIVLPKQRKLADFDSTDTLLFRVKVIAESDRRGVILAVAGKIRPQRTDGREEDRIFLIAVKSDNDLSDEIVRLELNDLDRPLLLINSTLGNCKDLARDPVFISLVLPAVFRQILTRILLIDKHFDTDDSDDWRSLWLQYAASLPGVELLSEDDILAEEDRIYDWIDNTVSAFSRKHRIRQTFKTYWDKESEE